MIAKRGILTVFLAMLLSAPSLAANIQVSWEAYQRGDYATALKEWRPLAEQGNAAAQVGLGVMYDNGQGVTQDFVEAAKWYRLAAEQGDSTAQNDLGVMYVEGRGVTQDFVQAHVWYNIAATRMPPGEDRDMAVKNRDNIVKFMTPAQVAEAQRRAREWRPKQLLFKQEDIGFLQWNLIKLGYDPGPADGIVGTLTREAILAFQRDHGLIADGEPSQELSDRAFEALVRRLSESTWQLGRSCTEPEKSACGLDPPNAS